MLSQWRRREAFSPGLLWHQGNRHNKFINCGTLRLLYINRRFGHDLKLWLPASPVRKRACTRGGTVGENEELRKKSRRWYFFMQVLWRATNVAFYEEIFNPPFTAPFNNMRALKFNAQPTNAVFATVNQMFGGFSQLPTTADHAVTKSLSTVQTTKQHSAVVGSWEEPPNIWLTVAKTHMSVGLWILESTCYWKAP